MNPFIAFCLYVASRVFVQYLKSRREDAAVKSSLHFLLAAMQVLKIKNPLTESFLVQLDVDLEGSGLDIPTNYSRWRFGHGPPVSMPAMSTNHVLTQVQGEARANLESLKCSPLFEIRDDQSKSFAEAVQGTNPPGVQSPWPLDSAAQSQSGGYPSLYAAEGISSGMQTGQDTGFGFVVQSAGTETSPDTSNQGGSGSKPASNQPTPSTLSNQNSSHTSYTSPPNQSGSSYTTSTGQGHPSPGFAFSTGAFNMNMATQMGQGVSPQQPNLNFGSTGMTPGGTGMTPIPDALWPAEGLPDGNEWMFSWPGSTPQP